MKRIKIINGIPYFEVDGEIVVSLPDGVDPSDFPGKFIRVRITGADLYDLEAELI